MQPTHLVRERLTHLASLLRENGEKGLAARVDAAISGTEDEVKSFLTSNDLWGGAGSIADQAGMTEGTRTDVRRNIERALIELGEMQLRTTDVNPRTEMWVETFRKWAQDRI